MNAPFEKAVALLQKLIAQPSFSREENSTADILSEFFLSQKLSPERIGNNILVQHHSTMEDRPCILLCSHHDTVKPNAGYSRDPFSPDIEKGKLYGLGSNDAGASLVSMIMAFLHLIRKHPTMNIILAAVAEEEISGPGGVSAVLSSLPAIDLAIVGEPTEMRMAVAEKGLVVIDGIVNGVPGHAAHENTKNPIYLACRDIQRIEKFKFDRESKFLGKTKASVTVINAGQAHNQVPAKCQFVVDVRVNEAYTLEEIVELLQAEVESKLTARSLRLRSSGLDSDHRMWEVARSLQLDTFGSATLSDQALMPFPSIKIGPGDTLRSHAADEFVYLSEIEDGIEKYIELVEAYINAL
ncbi:MAG: M20/M25/M40 family metallo-hydrolase [Saprospiraceae bacterium]|nr:M20/M25/M40 family metallo-hydrolase [Saprospiraceae bacterium]